MNAELILHIGRQALETALLVAAPVLGVAIAVGFLTAMLQAITSIRDMTLGMVLKIAAVGGTVLLTAGWTMQLVVGFTAEIFNHMQAITR